MGSKSKLADEVKVVSAISAYELWGLMRYVYFLSLFSFRGLWNGATSNERALNLQSNTSLRAITRTVAGRSSHEDATSDIDGILH